MISLIISLVILIVGYVIYSKVTEKVFSPEDISTPAIKINDGVDYIPLKTWKSYLIQLLNIAGTGPIFGALMGAVFGPRVFIWIVLGSILGGAVHDYMIGMISLRHDGASIAELSGIYLGKVIKIIMRIFSCILLILVGTVFITSPAALLDSLTPDPFNKYFWLVLIILYYIFATIVPIDKLIGKIYPIFGIVLIIMAVGIIYGLSAGNYQIPEIGSGITRPDNLPTWPFMFITVACGAISGFHATQSPMISKCLKSEKEGRVVFYGAMISEAVIALVWAAAGVAFYESTAILNEKLSVMGQSSVVYEISTGLLGKVGGILAIVGVVICPITSGDTAFRSARLILAEWTKLNQKKIKNRILISLPLLIIGTLLSFLDFNIIWRYFSWSNQTLAMIALWVCTMYLIKKSKYKYASIITAIPAAFMEAVSITYILMAEEGFRINAKYSYPIGIIISVITFVIYLIYLFNIIRKNKSLVLKE